jgi:hypothetical protein
MGSSLSSAPYFLSSYFVIIDQVFAMKTSGDSLDGHPYRSVFDGKQRTIELQIQVYK